MISPHRELERAFRITRTLFPNLKLRFVGDAGLDDPKVFEPIACVHGELVIRACPARNVEGYTTRLPRGEAEKLLDLTNHIAFEFEHAVWFTPARRTRRAQMRFGWLQLRLPETQPEVWVLVAQAVERDHDLVLLTNVPLEAAETVRQVYSDWRPRSQIEHGYRFDQVEDPPLREAGLDVEDLRVATLERRRRLFLFVLLAAWLHPDGLCHRGQFVCYIDRNWNAPAVRWLRWLGGKLDLPSRRRCFGIRDRDGGYVWLRSMGAGWQAAATLTFALNHPFPTANSTCG